MNIRKALRKIEKRLGLKKKKYNGLDITVDLEVADCEGYTYSHGKTIYLVLARLDMLVFAHELVHVVQLRHKLPLCEQQAYGLEQKVLKWLKKS